MKELSCYSIGHSNNSIETFVRMLLAHGVNCVADVRSAPYSRRHPQFNRKSIKTDLQLADIRYLYLGDSLGARHSTPSVLTQEGKVDFSRVRLMPAFQAGIDHVISGIQKGLCIALMCAESDPFDCHRFVLVSRELAGRGMRIEHIGATGETVSQMELEKRLLQKYCLHRYQPPLFEQAKSRDKLLAEAYGLRNRDIAYSSEGNQQLSENRDWFPPATID